MGKAVLDSYAVMAYLFKQKGCERVLKLIENAGNTGQPLLITSVNWAEVSYVVERKAGRTHWLRLRKDLACLPIEIVEADKELAECAAEFKVKGGISLGDCFAAALAKLRGLPVYTGDREFERVQDEVKVMWI